MRDWEETTVGVFCPFLYGKGLPETARKPGNIPVVSSAGVTGSHEEPLVRTGGIVIGRKGTVGSLTLLNRPFWPIDTSFYIPDEPKQRDLRFTFYLLKTLGLHKMNSDSAVPGLNRDNAHQRIICVPDLKEQKAIAAVLGALDDKIELNRRMNATLESMARALFKSWFVDFDPVRAKMEGKQPFGMDAATAALFPSRLVPSPLGDIPEGWEAGRLSDILELLYGKSLTKEDRQSGPYPVYGSGGVTGYNNQALVNGPGIVVGRKGTVGSLYWEDRNFFPIDTVFYVVPKQYFSLAYVFSQLECLGLENMNTDAAVPGLNRENAYRLDIVKPSQSILTAYTSIASEIRGKIRANNTEIEKLVQSRDYLLPKLMSGDIRIPDAEKFMEAA